MESECSNIFIYGDALFEILTRVDPRDIFNCILVSKDWLSVIISPRFRSNYGNRWKISKPTLVDSLRIQSLDMDGKRKFPATSNLGRQIYAWNVSYDFGSYICKSPKGDLLLFGPVAPDRSPLRLYVCKSISGGEPVQLPELPQLYYRDCYASIIPTVDDDNEYRVIMVNTGYPLKIVLVYSSLTCKWERFRCTCSTKIDLKHVEGGWVEGGVVAGGADHNVIYWPMLWPEQASLAAFNVNGGTIAMIPEPPFKKEKRDNRKYDFKITYGASPDQSQGSLQAVICSYHRSYNDWQSKQFAIQVWTLDDERDWRLLYKVRKCEIWTDNSTLLTSLFKGFRPHQCGSGGFVFVSFVPGKRDSIFVALEERVFIYHFGTGILEYVKDLKYDGTNPPLTMLDLGNSWPSSPPSLQLPL